MIANESSSTYGWISNRPEPGHAWFDPVVLALCRKVGAQRVLDLGCGNGTLCRRLVDQRYEVFGCDPDPSGIAIAQGLVPEATFKTLGAYDDPRAAGLPQVDLVVSTEVIEHLLLPRHLLRFAHRVLPPGGHLIVTTPYYGYLKSLIIALLGRWDGHHNVFWDHGHVKFFSPKTLLRMLREEDFDVVQFQGAGRLPFLWNTMIVLARKR